MGGKSSSRWRCYLPGAAGFESVSLAGRRYAPPDCGIDFPLQVHQCPSPGFTTRMSLTGPQSLVAESRISVSPLTGSPGFDTWFKFALLPCTGRSFCCNLVSIFRLSLRTFPRLRLSVLPVGSLVLLHWLPIFRFPREGLFPSSSGGDFLTPRFGFSIPLRLVPNRFDLTAVPA